MSEFQDMINADPDAYLTMKEWAEMVGAEEIRAEGIDDQWELESAIELVIKEMTKARRLGNLSANESRSPDGAVRIDFSYGKAEGFAYWRESVCWIGYIPSGFGTGRLFPCRLAEFLAIRALSAHPMSEAQDMIGADPKASAAVQEWAEGVGVHQISPVDTGSKWKLGEVSRYVFAFIVRTTRQDRTSVKGAYSPDGEVCIEISAEEMEVFVYARGSVCRVVFSSDREYRADEREKAEFYAGDRAELQAIQALTGVR